MRKTLKVILASILVFTLSMQVMGRSLDDTVVADIVAISNDATVLYGHGFPDNVTKVISSTDKIIYFFGSFRVLNAKKKVYKVILECIDKNGDVVLKGDVERGLSEEMKIGDDQSGRFEVSLGLETKPGSKVKNQTKALKDDEEYFVRVWIDGKIVALAGFRYVED